MTVSEQLLDTHRRTEGLWVNDWMII